MPLIESSSQTQSKPSCLNLDIVPKSLAEYMGSNELALQTPKKSKEAPTLGAISGAVSFFMAP